MSDFNPGDKTTKGSTIASGDTTTTHQFTGSVFIKGDLSASINISASAFYGDGANLTNVAATSPGGSDTQVQYNNGGAFAGNSNFTWTAASNTVYISGALNISSSLTTPVIINEDKDASLIIGEANIGNGGSSGLAYFSHKDSIGATNAAVIQFANGSTYLNSKSGLPLKLSINTGTKLWIDSAGNVGIGASFDPTYLLDVSGSSRLGADTYHVLYVTGAIDQSGSTVTFNVPDNNSQALRIKDGSNTYLTAYTTTGQETLQLNQGTTLPNDKRINFGSGAPVAHIVYSSGPTKLVISGAASGMDLSGSIYAPKIESGTIAGLSSYVGVNAQNLLVLTASAGGGGSTSPGGSDTQMQYNNGGAFGGVASLTYADGTGHLTVIDDKKLYFGSDDDGYIFYGNPGGGNEFAISVGADGGTIYIPDNDSTAFQINEAGNTYLRINSTNGQEQTTMLKTLAMSDDVKLAFGSGQPPSTIEYDANGSKMLTISGTYNGVVITGSTHLANSSSFVYGVPSKLADNTGTGEVAYIGTGSLTIGALYYMKSDGGWQSASAANTGSGESQLLGISLGNNPAVEGMLLRGFFDAESFYQDEFKTGSAVYIASASTAATEATVGTTGYISGAAPTASDSYARIVGYATDTAGVIYFNPGTNWVEIS